jgi:hypothetical protein
MLTKNKGLIEATRSGFEARVLLDLRNRGVSYCYESDKEVLDYVIEHKYHPDIVLLNGILIEVKGFFLTEDRRKMIAVRKQNPEKDIRLLFQNSSSPVEGAVKRKDGSKLTNKEWAEKHGFQWASKFVPQGWIDETRKSL